MKIETGSGFGELLERGGIYYGLPGGPVQKILETFINTIRIPDSITSRILLKAVMEREALMTTGIGNGIAVPHPRNPVITAPEEQFAAIGFLEHSADWKALDGKPVNSLILLVSASAQYHLKTLSIVSFFCQQDEFNKLLNEKAEGSKIIDYIKNTEKNWK
ncbi:MAG: PTS sugar transporter subunit IIA [Treponema sp.]|nr:PTS sugar transporter subunit IIA [Treponema sp.]